MSTRFAVAAAGAIVVASLVGCKSDEKKAEAASDKAVALTNTQCPYTGGKANPNVTTEYQGKTVGFCCGGCKNRWANATDADRDAMMAKMK